MMKDIMLFGAGHDGTKRQVEPGKESYFFNSQPVLSPTGTNRVSYGAEQVSFRVSTVYPEKGGFLIGVHGEEPSDNAIVEAIFKYNPTPLN
ncbi:TPA: hypothetical protein IBF34_002799 [Escherichia coli]|uniref:hypothetical protein n=1 Tax=Escherichia coli TaxID=562 RepID=UPI0004612FC9|nr:hypothetical protein [Escherichia coli]EER0913155.1 hypothetical protein [Escherichia coli O168:H8]EES8552736.1 hypothetical protein [Escherichia coli O168]EKE4532951.1 hypothetical protein [Escherichia coli O157]EKE4540868.1 hypothetical protein [Escherichia coli O103]EKM2494502.1 hypothetical protein [Escherichia coli O26]